MSMLEKQLCDLKKDFAYLPKPNKTLFVGEEVIVGSLSDCKIEEIVDDGLIYLISYTQIQNNYGEPIITPNQKRYIPWIDAHKKNNNNNSFIKNEDLKLHFMQQSINSLLIKVYHFGVDFNPFYQRDLVWSLKDKENLIDSIFNGYDIGKFVFVKNGWVDPLEILDGKQRLLSICDFYEDKFQYKGLLFSELSIKDRKYFKRFAISVAEIENISTKDKLRFFKKLNTSGKVMDKEHLERIDEHIKNMD